MLKYACLVLSLLLVFIMFFYLIVPGINSLFLSLKEAKELKDILTFIPDDMQITQVDSGDVMFVAWDYNHRSPRFFSKWSYEALKDVEDQQHHLDFKDMVWASACTPTYFKPAVI